MIGIKYRSSKLYSLAIVAFKNESESIACALESSFCITSSTNRAIEVAKNYAEKKFSKKNGWYKYKIKVKEIDPEAIEFIAKQ